MAKIISIHEYMLKLGVDETQFEDAVRRAREQGLLELPGLVEYYFLKGIKGSRSGYYAAIWVYKDREAWEQLWGTPENPRQKEDYPENWQVWEEEILAPFLDQNPDQISFTAYEEW